MFEGPFGCSGGGFGGCGVLCDGFGWFGGTRGDVGEVFGADMG